MTTSEKLENKNKAKHYRDGELGPCFICGKKARYIIVKDNRKKMLVDRTGVTIGACLRNACFNMLLLSNDVLWVGYY